MASIEHITKRIEGKQKEIAKLESKLARIEKAKESNWENNPYYYSESDLKWTLRDLEDARDALEKYTVQLATEKEKANSRNVPAILGFLAIWKMRVMEYYTNKFDLYLVAKAEAYREDTKYCDWHNNGGWKDANRKEIEAEHRKYQKEFAMKWAEMERYELREYDKNARAYVYKLNREKLQKELDQEANRKYDDIINRTNEICGKITDASGLRVGSKGDLDGVIIGERGKATVQTIGAGGYNIQCFHFRTLVHELK